MNFCELQNQGVNLALTTLRGSLPSVMPFIEDDMFSWSPTNDARITADFSCIQASFALEIWLWTILHILYYLQLAGHARLQQYEPAVASSASYHHATTAASHNPTVEQSGSCQLWFSQSGIAQLQRFRRAVASINRKYIWTGKFLLGISHCWDQGKILCFSVWIIHLNS